MSTEEHINQEPKSNETADPSNQAPSPKISTEQQTDKMEVFHRPTCIIKKRNRKSISSNS